MQKQPELHVLFVGISFRGDSRIYKTHGAETHGTMFLWQLWWGKHRLKQWSVSHVEMELIRLQTRSDRVLQTSKRCLGPLGSFFALYDCRLPIYTQKLPIGFLSYCIRAVIPFCLSYSKNIDASLCWIISQVESSVPTSVCCRRWGTAMTIPALCTTGRLALGGSAWRTRPSRPATHLWAEHAVMMSPALWGCKPAKSSVSGSMWARFLQKSKTSYGLQVWLRVHEHVHELMSNEYNTISTGLFFTYTNCLSTINK